MVIIAPRRDKGLLSLPSNCMTTVITIPHGIQLQL